MDKAARIEAIRHSAALAFKADVKALMTARFDRRSARIEALKRVKETEARLDDILASAATPEAAGAAAKQAEDAMDDAVLEAVALSLSSSASADMRAAQLETIHGKDGERRAEIRAIDAAPAPKQAVEAADVVLRSGQAIRALKTLASDPKKYLALAERFWNGEVRALSSTLGGSAAIDKLSLNVGERILSGIDKKLALSANRVNAAAVGRFIGLAGVGIMVVSVVVRAIADGAHWADTLAKSGISVGVSVALGLVITAEVVQTVVWAAFAVIAAWVAPTVTVVSSEVVALGVAGTAAESALMAGAAAIEVPPVAAVLIATGVVIALGIAITALTDFLIDTIFGGPIPPSMMVSMHAPMATSMSRQMASPMFRPMTGG